jgi:ATP-dependent Clp protease adaptor protein ClpS
VNKKEEPIHLVLLENMKIQFETQYQEETEVLVKEDRENEIVLFNDDVNTFDWVIQSLIEICEHDLIQAEQCALIVHTKGKCGVKNGSFDDLKPLCSALLDRGLSAEIH